MLDIREGVPTALWRQAKCLPGELTMVEMLELLELTGLGIVLGLRTAVEINRYSGRLPDLLFVRQERATIVRERAV